MRAKFLYSIYIQCALSVRGGAATVPRPTTQKWPDSSVINVSCIYCVYIKVIAYTLHTRLDFRPHYVPCP